MTSTLELSFYPLVDEYPSQVLRFLHQLKSIPGIELYTNGMSTIIIGDYDMIWKHLGKLMGKEMVSGSSVFVLKVAPGRRE